LVQVWMPEQFAQAPQAAQVPKYQAWLQAPPFDPNHH
jgi:hypothetical protein